MKLREGFMSRSHLVFQGCSLTLTFKVFTLPNHLLWYHNIYIMCYHRLLIGWLKGVIGVSGDGGAGYWADLWVWNSGWGPQTLWRYCDEWPIFYSSCTRWRLSTPSSCCSGWWLWILPHFRVTLCSNAECVTLLLNRPACPPPPSLTRNTCQTKPNSHSVEKKTRVGVGNVSSSYLIFQICSIPIILCIIISDKLLKWSAGLVGEVRGDTRGYRHWRWCLHDAFSGRSRQSHWRKT